MNSPDNERLGQWLDAALRNYGANEPRTGLESRILAKLSSARERSLDQVRWGLALAASVCAILLVTWAGWGFGRHAKSVSRIPAPVESVLPRDAPPATHPIPTNQGQKPSAVHQRVSVATATPRLGQFPTPRPLSEQEQLLEEYVAKFPEEAKLVAGEQAEAQKEAEQLFAENVQRRNPLQER
jgi:hypothetical protein